MLRGVRDIVGPKLTRLMYTSIVLPHIEYMDVVYGGTSYKNLQRLDVMHNRAARIITRRDRLTHVDDLLKEAKLVYLSVGKEVHINTYMYKAMNELAPQSTRDLFTLRTDYAPRITRVSVREELYIPLSKPGSTGKCISVRGPTSYNRMPEYLRRSPTLSFFKRNLKLQFGYEVG